MPAQHVIDDFLAQRRIAVVGVSSNPRSFATGIYRAMREHGYVVYAVGRSAQTVVGDRCYARLADVPSPIDGAILVVAPDAAVEAVHECAAAGIPRVWLHRGTGQGAVSEAALAACAKHGLAVVDGACPLMFLEPVRGVHRVHRFIRRRRGDLVSA